MRGGSFTIICLTLAAIFFTQNRSHAASGPPPVTIRVGVAEYQDLADQFLNYQQLFQELQMAAPAGVQFTLAIGTYGEVLDWYNRQEIDVAVFAAMPMGQLLASAEPDERSKMHSMYIATLQETEPTGGGTSRRLADALDNGQRFRQWDLTHYRPLMVVRQDSPVKTTADLATYQSKIKFLFVRPFSASGYIVPSYFLETTLHISPEEKSEFTFQHVNSLKRLADPHDKDGGKYLVAFVYDGVSFCKSPYKPEDSDSYRAACAKEHPFHMVEASDHTVQLEKMLVPFNSVVVNHLLRKEDRELFKSILLNAFQKREEMQHSSHFVRRIVPEKEWINEHLQIMQWSTQAKQVPSRLLYRTDLDHLFSDLEQYKKLSGQNPRLAVVLSGGGAKCAFQAGAIMALEEKLAALHKKDSPSNLKDFDVGLVVGTSGGAVNAMLMSLGITAQNSRDEIRNVWGSMTEDQFFRPSLLFRFAFGILIATTQITLVILVTTLFAGPTMSWPSIRWPAIFLSLLQLLLALYLTVQPFSAFLRFASIFILEIGMFILTRIMIRAFGKRFSDSLRLMGILLVIIAVPQLVIALLSSIRPSIFAVHNHAVAHFLMLVIFVAKWAAPLTFIVGLLLLAPHASRLVRGNHRVLLRVMAGVAGLFFALAVLTVLREESPSRPDGIRQFLNGHMQTFLKNRGVTPNGLSISQQIIKNPWLLKRDLIIAATRLPDASAPANEPDLYFYALRDGSEKDVDFHHDQHFIALNENPDLLLDVVLGSSTIYPIFPPQPLKGVKTRNPLSPEQDFRIVDGGYSHNTPILAALEWQATHLLVIEASPEPLAAEPRDFLDHAGAAFNFLFEEAQRLDTQSRGKIEVFSIRPRSECWKASKMIHCSMAPDPDLDTFDFYPSLLTEAFDRGFSDAKQSYPTAIGNFIREPGEPLLAPVAKNSPRQGATGPRVLQ